MYGLGNNKQQSHLPYLRKAGFWFGSDKLTASCGVFEAAWKQE